MPIQPELAAQIIARIAPYESGRAGYSAINANTEFFNPRHPAFQKYHIGLSYGIIQFTQDSGELGKLLKLMQQVDVDAFDEVFGDAAEELLQVTNSPGPASNLTSDGRSARCQPVAEVDLWEEAWTAVFADAGEYEPFQEQQIRLANLSFIDPLLPFAKGLNLNTDRALTMVVDRSINMGGFGSRKWILQVASPIQTVDQQKKALVALKKADLKAFQVSVGIKADGQWGPTTHAAMFAALRALGSKSPFPIPTRDQIMDKMVQAASTTGYAKRVRDLRMAMGYNDQAIAL